MLGKLTGWDDTIVALATPPGVGAIGVIRVSGPDSWIIVGSLFLSRDLQLMESHTLHVGLLRDTRDGHDGHDRRDGHGGEDALDEVVLSLFRGPRSYTGEDVVEISCHGSPYVQERIIQAILRKGARLARPGEFTRRAFLSGKMDLAQAEGVADLIAAQTAASARAALHTVRGGFSRDLRLLRERMLGLSALIELELDFSQEDVEFADRKELYRLVGEMEDVVEALIRSFRVGNVVRNGVEVAIIGKPNAGKSTLLNALLNEERAIVSEIAGTTRDTIEEVINIGGILFRIVDTAGLREGMAAAAVPAAQIGIDAAPQPGTNIAVQAASVDRIEAIGMERSRAKMEHADLVIYLFDVHDTPLHVYTLVDTLRTLGKRFLQVVNKIDLAEDAETRSNKDGGANGGGESLDEIRKRFPDAVAISAKNGKGIDVLKERLVALVLDGAQTMEGTIVTNLRHFEALVEVSKSLRDIKKGMDEKLTGDLLALDIRRCLHYLGEITGEEITTEERLGWIFGRFCIGK